MKWRGALSAQWRGRLLTGAVVGVAGYGMAVFLDFGPQPLAYAVMVAVLLALVWLVLDTLDAQPAHWVPTIAARADRADEATADLRLLTSHQQASQPSDAVRRRLVALADSRDPDLAADLRHEIDPSDRLSPARIDAILTRIEDSRDRR